MKLNKKLVFLKTMIISSFSTSIFIFGNLSNKQQNTYFSKKKLVSVQTLKMDNNKAEFYTRAFNFYTTNNKQQALFFKETLLK